jgi:hypothetical protein
MSSKTPRGKRVGPKNAPHHGTVNGYTNHKCRCQPCRDAFAEYMAEYRNKRFSGTGYECTVKGCENPASVAAGNGLCSFHHTEAQSAA